MSVNSNMVTKNFKGAKGVAMELPLEVPLKFLPKFAIKFGQKISQNCSDFSYVQKVRKFSHD